MEIFQNIDFRAAFFDIAHTPFAILDKDMVFLDVNETALSILEIKRDDVIGKKLVNVLPFIMDKQRYESYLNVLNTGRHITFDEVKVKTDSKELIFSIKAFKVGDGLGMAGLNITNLVQSINDLEYAQYELEMANSDLRKQNVELEEFSYVASHDLKAPLTNVEMLLSMLGEEGAITEQGRPYYEKLTQAVGLMSAKLSAINRVIALKAHEGNPKKIISFDQVINDIRNELSESIRSTGTEIKTDFSDCPKIYMDPIQMHSILQNLIVNAIKYRHPERPPRIHVSSKTFNNMTEIKVKDNGLGFDKSRGKGKVFGLFKRMHTHVEGLGIGLYMVKSIAQSHGGYVDVTTKINKGTTFKIVI